MNHGRLGCRRLNRRRLNRGRINLAGAAAGERDFYEDCLMRRLIRPALFVLLLLCLRLPDFAKTIDSAKALYDKGQDAEARQNYEQAFDYFKEAYNLKPKDLR